MSHQQSEAPREETSAVDQSLDTTHDRNVGGQAVIEGVMMRSPTGIATAVRLPDGSIEVQKRPYVSFVKRHTWLNIPVLRGALSFFEMLVIGLQTLNWSADIQMQYEQEADGGGNGSSLGNTLMLAGSMIFAFAVALGVFFALPIWIATLLGLARGAFLFNLVAGAIRLTLFILYIYGITFIPDIKRVFRYHGAEHMSIFALEAERPLTVESVRDYSRFHPRCGTSFILIVALLSIFFFGIADSLFVEIVGHVQSFAERFATHILLLPFVAGASFEALKLSGKYRSHPIVRILVAPGLWIQNMTTADPDDDMLEIAICALNAALETGSETS